MILIVCQFLFDFIEQALRKRVECYDRAQSGASGSVTAEGRLEGASGKPGDGRRRSVTPADSSPGLVSVGHSGLFGTTWVEAVAGLQRRGREEGGEWPVLPVHKFLETVQL